MHRTLFHYRIKKGRGVPGSLIKPVKLLISYSINPHTFVHSAFPIKASLNESTKVTLGLKKLNENLEKSKVHLPARITIAVSLYYI